MDKFVVRIPRSQENPFRQQMEAKPLRQMTIESLRGVVVFEDFDRAKLVLTRANSSSEDKLDMLAGLAKKTPSAAIITSTGLGDILDSLSSHPDEQVASEAKRVGDFWRACNLRKANRASIEVRCDARTQKLRDAARRMIQDSLKSTLLAQTRHRGRKEVSSPAGVKRRKRGDCVEVDDTCESLAVNVDESLVSDVGCVVSQTSLGYSKGIRIDLDRYNSMMDSLDAGGDSDSESCDEDDDVLFCNESGLVDETLDSSRVGVIELLRDVDSYLDSQNEKKKNVGDKGSRITPDKDDKSLHRKGPVLREDNYSKGDSKILKDTERTLQNEGEQQKTIGKSDRHHHSNNLSELKTKHNREKSTRVKPSKVSSSTSPDELSKDVIRAVSTDEGYVGSCDSQSSVENSALKSEKSPTRVVTELQCKRKRRREDKEEGRHQTDKGERRHKKVKTDTNTNSVLLDTATEQVGTLELHKSYYANCEDTPKECSSSDIEKIVCKALCETNLNEPQSKRLNLPSNKNSHKKSKKSSKNKLECENFPSISNALTTDECLSTRKSKKHKKRHASSESLKMKKEGDNSTTDGNRRDKQSESPSTNDVENDSQLFDSLVVKEEHGPIVFKTSEIEIHEQPTSTTANLSSCNKDIKFEDLRKTHEDDCTGQHCTKLKVDKRGHSESSGGSSCNQVQNLMVKKENCMDTTLTCEFSPCIKTTCKTTHTPSNNTNCVSTNYSTCTKEPSLENESNSSRKESTPTKELTLSKIPTSIKEHSSISKSKSSSSVKECSSSSKKSSSSEKESSHSSKKSSSSRKKSTSCMKECSSSSKKSSSSDKEESSSSGKEKSSSSGKEKSSYYGKEKSSSSRKEKSSSSRKEKSSSSGKEKSSSSGKEKSSSSGKEKSSSSGKEKSSSSGKEKFSSSGKEKSSSSGKEKSSSCRIDSNISKTDSDSLRRKSDSSKNYFTEKTNSSNKESSASKEESSISRKESNTSRKERKESTDKFNSSRTESSDSKKEFSSSKVESSSFKKHTNSTQDSNCFKKQSSSSMSCPVPERSSKRGPLDAAEAATLSETIERELFQVTRRLVNKRYKQTVRRLVFAIKHQDKVRRRVIAGKLTVGDIVKSYVEEE